MHASRIIRGIRTQWKNFGVKLGHKGCQTCKALANIEVKGPSALRLTEIEPASGFIRVQKL